jgi:hypothetical protein
MKAIYAVCVDCAHVEPRPLHAETDWFYCEHCGGDCELERTLETAEERSREIMKMEQETP